MSIVLILYGRQSRNCEIARSGTGSTYRSQVIKFLCKKELGFPIYCEARMSITATRCQHTKIHVYHSQLFVKIRRISPDRCILDRPRLTRPDVVALVVDWSCELSNYNENVLSKKHIDRVTSRLERGRCCSLVTVVSSLFARGVTVVSSLYVRGGSVRIDGSLALE